MVASCVGAALNVLLNYIFIPIFGYYAAGYTTLFCYIVYSFAHYFFYKVIISNNNLEKAFDMRVVCGISVVMLIVMVVMTILYNFTMIRYAACFILCLLIILNRKGIVLKIKEIRNNK
jgi:O-antigen/teichoic acid export membrane protein